MPVIGSDSDLSELHNKIITIFYAGELRMNWSLKTEASLKSGGSTLKQSLHLLSKEATIINKE